MKPTIALYARVSTERQAESRTIEQQIEALTAYATQQGWEVTSEHTYRDDGVSGARLDRPALDRLRDAATRGEIDVVVITSPDRLARRYAYQVWLLEEFERVGCQVVFLERPLSDDPQDALVIQIRGAVAEYERTVIADRMRRGRLAALRAGHLLPWSTPPYGYRVDPRLPRDPASVGIDEHAAAVVRQIFTWYVEEGLTLYQVAKGLTMKEIPTPKGYPVWTASTVRKILLNESYIGMAYGNQRQMVPAKRRYPLIGREPKTEGGESCRLRPRDEWIGIPVPAIVSTELFDGAKQRLAQNRQWATRNTKSEYLLRCLLSCGRCGLAHHVWNNGRYAYYRCRGMDTLINRHVAEACHARQVPTDRLDAAVWADVCAVLTEPTVLNEALTRAQRGWLTVDERSARRQDLQRRQHEVQRQIQRLIDAYTAEIIDLEELRARRAKLEERLATLRREGQQVAAEEAQVEHIETIARQLESFRAAIADGLEHASFATRRTIVALIVDRVVVDAPEVEIRYVIPLTGIAQRKGVLSSHHRASQPRAGPADRCGGHLPQRGGASPFGGSGPRRAARRMASLATLLQCRIHGALGAEGGESAPDVSGELGEPRR